MYILTGMTMTYVWNYDLDTLDVPHPTVNPNAGLQVKFTVLFYPFHRPGLPSQTTCLF